MRTTGPITPGPGSPVAMDYGLGLIAYDTPCGKLWGHDGGVIGMATLSLSTEDGGRQASSGINMTWHPGTEAGEQAWVVHTIGAMCGTTNRIAASDAPSLLIDAGMPVKR